MEKFSVICPCCEATIVVDSQTGAVLAHEEKKKPLGSFEDLAGELSKQKELRELNGLKLTLLLIANWT